MRNSRVAPGTHRLRRALTGRLAQGLLSGGIFIRVVDSRFFIGIGLTHVGTVPQQQRDDIGVSTSSCHHECGKPLY